jgi:cell fate regulator YaaT (PSP1 superfamily)
LNNLVGVKFKKEGKIYYFDPCDLSLQRHDIVLVDTDNGTAIGTVTDYVKAYPVLVNSDKIKKVLRLVTDEDLRIREANRILETEAREYCGQRIVEHQLPMKLVEVECLFDKSKMIFSFASESRVDFRELVKDLVQKFRTRIELRQIGARQETKILKGLGICGREVCCGSFLHNLDRVSVKMAKEQNMPLNPEKISGLCGRLMCCLAFEYEAYLDLKKEMPKCGRTVQTASGTGKVIRQNILKNEVVVMFEDKKEMTFKSNDVKRIT